MKKSFALAVISLLALNLCWSELSQAGPYKAGPLMELKQMIEELQQKLVPIGTIVMWSGEIDENNHPISDGSPRTDWVLCDGTNGTPDLTDRFVIGSTPGEIGNTGGTEEVVLDTENVPAHTHWVDLTSSLSGQHMHSHQALTDKHYRIAQSVDDVVVALNDICITVAGTRYCVTPGSLTAHVKHDLDFAHNDGYSLRQTHEAGTHSHTVSGLTTFDDTIEPDAIPTMPPYYALAFIMYIGDDD